MPVRTNNINPNPILVIRPYVNGYCNIRPGSSPKAIRNRLCTTHHLTPMFLFSYLQPQSARRNRSGSCDNPAILGPGLC